MFGQPFYVCDNKKKDIFRITIYIYIYIYIYMRIKKNRQS